MFLPNHTVPEHECVFLNQVPANPCMRKIHSTDLASMQGMFSSTLSSSVASRNPNKLVSHSNDVVMNVSLVFERDHAFTLLLLLILMLLFKYFRIFSVLDYPNKMICCCNEWHDLNNQLSLNRAISCSVSSY